MRGFVADGRKVSSGSRRCLDIGLLDLLFLLLAREDVLGEEDGEKYPNENGGKIIEGTSQKDEAFVKPGFEDPGDRHSDQEDDPQCQCKQGQLGGAGDERINLIHDFLCAMRGWGW